MAGSRQGIEEHFIPGPGAGWWVGLMNGKGVFTMKKDSILEERIELDGKLRLCRR